MGCHRRDNMTEISGQVLNNFSLEIHCSWDCLNFQMLGFAHSSDQFHSSTQNLECFLHQEDVWNYSFLDLSQEEAAGSTAGLGCVPAVVSQMVPSLPNVSRLSVGASSNGDANMYWHFHFSVSLLIPFGACVVHKGATISAVILPSLWYQEWNSSVEECLFHCQYREDLSCLLLFQYLTVLEIHADAVPHDVRTNSGDLSINQQSVKI